MPIEAIFAPRERGRVAAIAAGVVAALLLAGYPLDAWLGGGLRYERSGLAAGELWRLVSAHVAHLSWAHAALNAAALLLVLQIFKSAVTMREWIAAAAAAVIVIDAGLWWLDPAVDWYVGASGVLHGMFVMGIAGLWRGGERRIAFGLGVGLVAKLAFEWWQGPLASGLDLPVVTAAHRYGATGGLVALAATRLWAGGRPRRQRSGRR
jgi:rhomboid family GlyGly-CTERM serine protease